MKTPKAVTQIKKHPVIVFDKKDLVGFDKDPRFMRRIFGEFEGQVYLNSSFDWLVVKDEAGVNVLVRLRKGTLEKL